MRWVYVRCYRRHTTLLEVLIALSLTVLVLTTLTFFYREMSVIDAEIDKVKREQFRLRYVESRLNDVVPKAVSEKSSKKNFVFFSTDDEGLMLPGTESLVFIFDNDISLDSPFSNHVLARLFVDLEGRLTLLYWPSPKWWEEGGSIPRKKEVLLENVEELSFMFFHMEDDPDPEEKEGESGKEFSKPQAPGQMTHQIWRQEFGKLPAIIQISIGLKASDGKKKEEMVFVFPLTNAKTHVIYK